MLQAVHDTIREEKVSYDEYNALKAWLIQVGEDGEWPLFLDVWVEHVVEEVATDHREGSKGTIEGPYYVPNAPERGAKGTIPMRDGEAGTPMVWSGQVTSTGGAPSVAPRSSRCPTVRNRHLRKPRNRQDNPLRLSSAPSRDGLQRGSGLTVPLTLSCWTQRDGGGPDGGVPGRAHRTVATIFALLGILIGVTQW